MRTSNQSLFVFTVLRLEREAGADLVWDLVRDDVQALGVERETERGLDTGTKGLRVACLR